MKEWLFSYGTLRRDDVQLQLFGRLVESLPDTLKGYRIQDIENKWDTPGTEGYQPYHLMALPSGNPGDKVEGRVLELSKEELLVADQYEPEDYKRILVGLESGKKAWIYVAAKNN
jgi:gamma-glutamylcyclotransferase (GGCT)/AIG2-like uncharacterized protein YtfP